MAHEADMMLSCGVLIFFTSRVFSFMAPDPLRLVIVSIAQCRASQEKARGAKEKDCPVKLS
jgi:hypothetical protein